MFTGIITDIGRIRSIISKDGYKTYVINSAYDIDSIDIGASISCAGACLTVIAKEGDELSFDVSSETLDKTIFASLKQNDYVNLERALKIGDELGGHIVTGHVDFIGKILAIENIGANRKMTFSITPNFEKFIAPKGSITINGVSLTVNEAHKDRFTVNLIPHTLNNTNFAKAHEGDDVNIEIDLMARYAARLSEFG